MEGGLKEKGEGRREEGGGEGGTYRLRPPKGLARPRRQSQQCL